MILYKLCSCIKNYNLHNYLFIISFGPAHPAAHGVFRLLISLNSEVILDVLGYQGLLFRASENLCEQRQLELVSGY